MAEEDEPAEMVDPLQDLVLRLRDDECASSSSPAGLALPTPLDRESAFGSSVGIEPPAVERRHRGRAARPDRDRSVVRGSLELRRGGVAWRMESNPRL